MTDEIENESTPVASAEAEGTPEEVATAPAAAKTSARPAATDTDTATEDERARRKVREGIVSSEKMESTVVVTVTERVRHPKYRKTVQRTKKLYVHDAGNTAKVGDRVRVMETRPLSKLKRWRLVEIVERAR